MEMSIKKVSGLLYSIGETILLEIHKIKRISYREGEFPDTIIIELRGGEKFELSLHPFGEY